MSNERTVMAVIRAARPSFRNDNDKIAFAVHAFFHSSGFVLTATGNRALADYVLSSSSTDEVGIDNWNEFEDHYAFIYSNPEKELDKVLVKCLVMNGKFLVDALADGSSEPVHLEIDIDDYVAENGSGNYSAQYKNLGRLVTSLDEEVISKLYGSSSNSSSPSNPPSSETRGVISRSYIDGAGVIVHETSYANDNGVRINETTGPQLHPSGAITPINPIHGDYDFPWLPTGIYLTWAVFVGGCVLLVPSDPHWHPGVAGEHGFPRAQPGVLPGARSHPRGSRGASGSERNRFASRRNPRVLPAARSDPRGSPGAPGSERNRFVSRRNPPRRHEAGTHSDLQHFGDRSDLDASE